MGSICFKQSCSDPTRMQFEQSLTPRSLAALKLRLVQPCTQRVRKAKRTWELGNTLSSPPAIRAESCLSSD